MRAQLLRTFYVREGWKIDQAAATEATRILQWLRKGRFGSGRWSRGRRGFFHSHGQSLDWVFDGDIGGMISSLAKHSKRAAKVAGKVCS
jgi:hypothetical protein